MQDREFLNALDTVAGELLRRAEDYAGSDTMEPCNLVLTNAATGVLIALNVLSGREASPLVIEGDAMLVEAAAATRIPCGVAGGTILTQGAV